MTIEEQLRELAFENSGQSAPPHEDWVVREYPEGWLLGPRGTRGRSHTIVDRQANVGSLVVAHTSVPEGFARLAELVATRPEHPVMPIPANGFVVVDREGWPFLFRIVPGPDGGRDEIWSVPHHAWTATTLLDLVRDLEPNSLRALPDSDGEALLARLEMIPPTLPANRPEEHYYLATRAGTLVAALWLHLDQRGVEQWRRYRLGRSGLDLIPASDVEAIRHDADNFEEVSEDAFMDAAHRG